MLQLAGLSTIYTRNGMEFKHEGPQKLRLGIVVARGIDPMARIPELEAGIDGRLRELANGISDLEDAFRTQVRDVFRNGSYKPSGRAKPASEYLLGAAAEGRFPRINTLVDCCNLLSMSSLLPISIWDIDVSASDRFVFRLGVEGESYVFNSAGHEIGLHDLISGCIVDADDTSRPVINAVKDSMETKTSELTTNVAAAIYSPLSEGPAMSLEGVCEAFCRILGQTGESVRTEHHILMPGESVRF